MNISKKGLIVALLASVAINLVVLSVVGGATVAGMRYNAHDKQLRRPPPPKMQFEFDPRAFIHALPNPERRNARIALQKASTEHKRNRTSTRQVRNELGRLLSAEQLDHKKIENALTKLRSLSNDSQKIGQSIVLDILRDLDPKTRQRVVKKAGLTRGQNRAKKR